MIKFILIIGLFFSCGKDEAEVVTVGPTDTGTGGYNGGGSGSAGGYGQKASFTEARQIMGQYCESCHANSPWLRDGTSLINSAVEKRVRNRSMPPLNSSKTMPNDARQRLLTFFE